jgi:ubiquinone/menaquinone biosynthesis C-methylase UbiE
MKTMIKWKFLGLNKIVKGLNKKQIISKYGVDFYNALISKSDNKSHPSYDKLMNDLISLMEHLRIYKNDYEYHNLRILDLGCGYGEHAIFLSQHNIVVGLDNDIKKIRIFKKIKNVVNPHLPVFPIYGDAMKLPFKDESFDIVCCFQFISHVYNLIDSLLEIKRVLKRGGVIIIVDSSRKNLWSKFRYYIELPKKYAYIQKVKRSIITGYCNKRRIQIANNTIDKIVKGTRGWSKEEILMILNKYARGNTDINQLLHLYNHKFPYRDLETGNLIDQFFTPSVIIKLLQKIGFWNVKEIGKSRGLKWRLIHYFWGIFYNHIYCVMGRR